MTTKLIIIFGIAITAAILLGGLAFSQSALAGGQGQPKVTICHVDQDTGEKKTITISNKAVEKHKTNHGDEEGECVDEPEPVCGDGNQDPGETCDDAGESSTCDADCTAVVCGDGVTNTSAGETCDASGESASCDADCTAVVCGDGVTNTSAGETCDNGGNNGTPGDSCSSSCEAATSGLGMLACVCTGPGGSVNIFPNVCIDTCDDTTLFAVCGPRCPTGTVPTSGTCAQIPNC